MQWKMRLRGTGGPSLARGSFWEGSLSAHAFAITNAHLHAIVESQRAVLLICQIIHRVADYDIAAGTTNAHCAWKGGHCGQFGKWSDQEGTPVAATDEIVHLLRA
jgi:hypothetical protein